LIELVTGDCKILSKNMAIVLAPTASIAGATQVSGRIVETGIHKLRRLGLNPNTIKNAWGIAPIAPVHPRFAEAMARTNDAILYGGTAYYSIECDSDERIEGISKKAPSGASKSYGKSFLQILKEADADFYKIDPDLFAPAIVVINNVRTGRVFAAGKINPELLHQSFGVKIGHSMRVRQKQK